MRVSSLRLPPAQSSFTKINGNRELLAFEVFSYVVYDLKIFIFVYKLSSPQQPTFSPLDIQKWVIKKLNTYTTSTFSAPYQ